VCEALDRLLKGLKRSLNCLKRSSEGWILSESRGWYKPVEPANSEMNADITQELARFSDAFVAEAVPSLGTITVVAAMPAQVIGAAIAVAV